MSGRTVSGRLAAGTGRRHARAVTPWALLPWVQVWEPGTPQRVRAGIP